MDIREPYELEVEGVSNAIHNLYGRTKKIDEIPNDSTFFHGLETDQKYDAFSSANKLCKGNYCSLEEVFRVFLNFLQRKITLFYFCFAKGSADVVPISSAIAFIKVIDRHPP